MKSLNNIIGQNAQNALMNLKAKARKCIAGICLNLFVGAATASAPTLVVLF